MPVTIRRKQDLTSTEKDSVSPPPSAGKVDLKNKPTAAAKGPDAAKSLTEKTTKSADASKATGTSTPTTTARQRARDRRRGRVEVSPEPDSSNSPDPEASSGRIKNLAGFWATNKNDVQVASKKRFEVSERTEKADSETDSSDSDSDLDTLKHAHESQPSAETIEVEKGHAKSIANMWQNRKEEDLPAKRKPFKLDLQTEEPTVFENEPVVLEGVIRSDDPPVRDDIVVGRPGRIKDLAINFATNSHSKADSSDEEEESTEKHSSVASKNATKEVIERGKIRNVRARWNKRQQKSKASGSDSDSDESSATEATPRRSSRNKDQVFEQAKVGNVRERWKRQDGFGDKDEAIPSGRQAPARLHSLVTAKEYGVFENEPTVRDDVVRADDEQPDIINSDRTKKLRRMWTMMDKEVMKDKEPVEKPIKPTKKKEEKRDIEPEVAKPQTTKPQKVAGRLHGVKDESSKPKEEAKPKKGHRKTGREVESEKAVPKDQQQEPEGRGKLQRAFTVATVGDNKPAAPKSPSLTRYSSRKKVA